MSHSKLFFNSKDVRENSVLQECSYSARSFFVWLATYAGQMEDPGYLFQEGRAMKVSDIAEMVCCPREQCAEALKELLDRRLILQTRQGVFFVVMVAKGAARSMKNSRNGRINVQKRMEVEQYNLFKNNNNRGRFGGHVKNAADHVSSAQKNSPLYTPLKYKKRVKNVFYQFSGEPETLEAANAENRRESGNVLLQWLFYGRTVKMRGLEVMQMRERFGFDRDKADAILKRHDKWMQKLPPEKRCDWRRFLIAYCERCAMKRVRRKPRAGICSARQHDLWAAARKRRLSMKVAGTALQAMV